MWLMKPAFFDLHLSAMQHEAELKEGYANAIYPDRIRTLTPARRVETLILWNFPSQLPCLATGENGEPSERKTSRRSHTNQGDRFPGGRFRHCCPNSSRAGFFLRGRRGTGDQQNKENCA